ncbi:dihydrofolate reductase [Croceibacterium sp. TMG7-5b_MA50]|uniref:dihydrofolate reductase n=1 Tax=Croceibacterium sp. TMG7-5b_MA50 TaxID=3121290 RepID=UPI0032221786
MADRQIIFVVARASDGTIALAGDVPWRIPADLRRFRRLTTGLPMVMGRKTFDSLPGLLPGRRHIVITRQPDWQAEGAEVAHDVAGALALCGEGDVMVIGGAEIFALFEPLATRLEITEVEEDTGGEVRMPPPGPYWMEVGREAHPAADGWPPYAFVTYQRRP